MGSERAEEVEMEVVEPAEAEDVTVLERSRDGRGVDVGFSGSGGAGTESRMI